MKIKKYVLFGLILGAIVLAGSALQFNKRAYAAVGSDCLAIKGISTEFLQGGVANSGRFLFNNANWPQNASKACVKTATIKAGDIIKFPLTGWIWNSNLGWTSLSCENGTNSGVACGPINYKSYLEININTKTVGKLTGFWWTDNMGWVSLSCPNSEWGACTQQYGGTNINLNSRVGGYITLGQTFAWNSDVGWMNLQGVELPYSDPDSILEMVEDGILPEVTESMLEIVNDYETERIGREVAVSISISPDPVASKTKMDAEKANPTEDQAALNTKINPVEDEGDPYDPHKSSFVTTSGGPKDAYNIIVALRNRAGQVIQNGAEYSVAIQANWCDKVRFDQVAGAVLGACRNAADASPVIYPKRIEAGGFVFVANTGYVGRIKNSAPTSAQDTITLEKIILSVTNSATGERLYNNQEYVKNQRFDFMPEIELHLAKVSQDNGTTFTNAINAERGAQTLFRTRLARYRTAGVGLLPANNNINVEFKLTNTSGVSFLFNDAANATLQFLLSRYVGVAEAFKMIDLLAHIEGGDIGLPIVGEKFESQISYQVGANTIKYKSRSLIGGGGAAGGAEDVKLDVTANVIGNIQLNARFEVSDGKIAKPVGQRLTANRDPYYKNVKLMLRGVNASSNQAAIKNFNSNGNVKDGKVYYYSRPSNAIGGNDPFNVTIALDNNLTTERTIVVEGGNLFINKSIIAGDNGKLGIIVLKDKKGLGGNIYIHPSVTDIHANIFADGSVFSYSGVVAEIGADGVPNIADPQTTLKNQLTFVGTISSNNTYGGASQNPIILGDGSVTADAEKAKKYDLNWLRYSPLIVRVNADGLVQLPNGDLVSIEDANLTKPREAGGDLSWPADFNDSNFSVASFRTPNQSLKEAIAAAKANYPINIIYSPATDTLPGF